MSRSLAELIDELPIEAVDVAELKAHPRNYRTHPEEQLEQIVASLEQNGAYRNIVIAKDGTILAGHGVWEAARRVGRETLPAKRAPLKPDDPRAIKILVADNELPQLAQDDDELLLALLRDIQNEPGLYGSGYDDAMLAQLLAAADDPGGGQLGGATLATRFGAPPFSVLDARSGAWRERKKAWIALGIKSEEGRPQNLLKMSDTILAAQASQPNKSTPQSNSGNDPTYYEKKKAVEAELGRELTTAEFERDYYKSDGTYSGGTSIFDPVLTELILRWFAPPNARVLDPFAGGSVRGVVTSWLGHRYTGFDLRAEQVKANKAQAKEILRGTPTPDWKVGDSRTELDKLKGPFDLILTCPPYGNLEVYSDDPQDLSTMKDDEFDAVYAEILGKAAAQLEDDRFAAIVMGNIRRKDGSVRDLCSMTTEIMEGAGLRLFNDAILVTAVGSLALRAARIFLGGRKLARTHQQVLIYNKGANPDKALGALSEEAIVIPEATEDDD